MKKILAVLITIIFVIGSLTACGTQTTAPNNQNSTTVSTESNLTDTTNDFVPESATPENEENKNSPTPEVDYAPGNNYFLNENNNFYDQNAVSVRPKYVYWYDGKLIAECFVVNGFNHPVYNINVKSLSLSNADGLIAEGSFGSLEGVTLQPYTHVVWTFTFSADCIAKYGADITSLIYNSNVSNNF